MVAIKNPFQKEGIVKFFAKINEQYFNAHSEFNAFNIGFVTEEIIKLRENPDPETKIFFWLWRIQRYFQVSYSNETENSKNETAMLIAGFLKELPQFPDKFKEYICKDEKALNCLVFSLLVCKDKNDWESVIKLINDYDNTLPLLPLLQWCFLFYFDETNASCETVLAELIASHTKDSEFTLPVSPLSFLFKHVALCQWYSKNPQTHPISSLSVLLPSEDQAQTVSVFPYIIKQIGAAELFSNHKNSVHQLSIFVIRRFLEQFRISNGEFRHSLAQFNTKEFKQFLSNFLIKALNNMDAFDQVEHLIGLSQMIQFFNPKYSEFCRDIYINGLALVRKLFALQQYSEAYRLYDDLTFFYTGNDRQNKVRARSALYCISARIDEWLKGTAEKPKFNDKELEFLPVFRTLNIELGSNEIPTAPLFQLTKKLGERFKQSEDEMTRSLCENYFSMISNYLKGSQTKEVAVLFQIPKVQMLIKKETNSVALKHHTSKSKTAPKVENETSQSNPEPDTKVLVTVEIKPVKIETNYSSKSEPKVETNPLSEAAISRESKPKLPVKILPDSEHKKPRIPPKTPIATIAWSKPEAKRELDLVSWPKLGANPTFFAPKPESVVPKDQFISRDYIPQSVMQVIDQLREELPEAEIYFSGAGPSNILDGMKPNDYDLLVVNSTLLIIYNLLQQKGLKPEIRSLKHPIIFCDIGKGITLDLTVRPLALNEEVQHVLEDDFYFRDFNINALYCKFTKENKFKVFSFWNALENRNARIIESIQYSISSFQEDPTRLFRLAKNLITNPDYVMIKELQQALKDLKGQWMALFHNYMKADPGNIYRLNHAIKKLFTRHSYVDINKALHQLGGLYELTEHTLDKVNLACSKIPVVNAESKFIYWVLANRLKSYELGKSSQLCPLHSILVLNELEQDFLQFIYDKAPGKTSDVQVYVKEIRTLVEGFKLPSEDTNNKNQFRAW